MDQARKHVAARFGGFALGHFGLSLGCTALGFALLLCWMAVEPCLPPISGGLAWWMVWLLAAVLMGAYVPVGYCVARTRGWDRARGREGLWAVLLPALVAWAWGGLGTGLLLTGECQAALQMAWVLVAGAAFLALPSWYFMALCLFCGIFSPLPQSGEWLWLLSCLFLAGLLPPLLFHLGAQMGARAGLCAGRAGGQGEIP